MSTWYWIYEITEDSLSYARWWRSDWDSDAFDLITKEELERRQLAADKAGERIERHIATD